jgi:dihydroflavonol-4-reductase
MNNPIAVITGANGFVGSHLVDLLLDKKYKVRCLVRKTSNMRWLEGKNIETIDTGLFDTQGVRKAFNGASYIFHVAGVVKSKKPEGYFKGNVDTTRNLLETALEFKDNIKRFLIVSSQTATGPSLDGNPVNEETECHPITTYGRSKLAEEKLARTYMDRLPITICRAPAVYGERDSEILIFFKTFNKGLMTTIGFNEKKISLIHVIDLVNGFYLAAINDKSKNQVYFISSEKYYTWEEIGEVTSKIIGKNPVKLKVPHSIVFSIASIAQFFAAFSSRPATLNIEKAKDITQTSWTCDTRKAVKDLDYHQNISIEEGIKRTVDWYKGMKWI